MARTSRRARRTSPLRITPAFELFYKSKDRVLKNSGIFIALYLLPFIFLFNSWIINASQLHGRSHWQWVFQNRSAGWMAPTLPAYAWGYLFTFAVWGVLMLALSFFVQIMTQAAQLEAAENKIVDFNRLWRTTKEVGWRMVGLYLLVGLYILVGLILLVIPGLIMLRRYFLAPYVMLDQKTGIREAMDRSAALSAPNTGAIWGIIGVMILIGLINVLPVFGGLIALVVGALYGVAPALRYQELKKLNAR